MLLIVYGYVFIRFFLAGSVNTCRLKLTINFGIGLPISIGSIRSVLHRFRHVAGFLLRPTPIPLEFGGVPVGSYRRCWDLSEQEP